MLTLALAAAETVEMDDEDAGSNELVAFLKLGTAVAALVTFAVMVGMARVSELSNEVTVPLAIAVELSRSGEVVMLAVPVELALAVAVAGGAVEVVTPMMLPRMPPLSVRYVELVTTDGRSVGVALALAAIVTFAVLVGAATTTTEDVVPLITIWLVEITTGVAVGPAVDEAGALVCTTTTALVVPLTRTALVTVVTLAAVVATPEGARVELDSGAVELPATMGTSDELPRTDEVVPLTVLDPETEAVPVILGTGPSDVDVAAELEPEDAADEERVALDDAADEAKIEVAFTRTHELVAVPTMAVAADEEADEEAEDEDEVDVVKSAPIALAIESCGVDDDAAEELAPLDDAADALDVGRSAPAVMVLSTALTLVVRCTRGETRSVDEAEEAAEDEVAVDEPESVPVEETDPLEDDASAEPVTLASRLDALPPNASVPLLLAALVSRLADAVSLALALALTPVDDDGNRLASSVAMAAYLVLCEPDSVTVAVAERIVVRDAVGPESVVEEARPEAPAVAFVASRALAVAEREAVPLAASAVVELLELARPVETSVALAAVPLAIGRSVGSSAARARMPASQESV